MCHPLSLKVLFTEILIQFKVLTQFRPCTCKIFLQLDDFCRGSNQETMLIAGDVSYFKSDDTFHFGIDRDWFALNIIIAPTTALRIYFNFQEIIVNRFCYLITIAISRKYLNFQEFQRIFSEEVLLRCNNVYFNFEKLFKVLEMLGEF